MTTIDTLTIARDLLQISQLPRRKAMKIRMKMEQMIYATRTEVAASEAAEKKAI